MANVNNTQLSQYEVQRLQNIERNKALIANLGLNDKGIMNQLGVDTPQTSLAKKRKKDDDSDYEGENDSNDEDADDLEYEEEMIFQGIYVYVDTGSDKRKKGRLEVLLKSNGAFPQKTFNTSVTHVIFNNGTNSTRQKAIDRNSYFVTDAWVTACIEENDLLPEHRYEIEQSDEESIEGSDIDEQDPEQDDIRDWIVDD